MSRAAVLPAGPDPFLNAEWLRHFSRWAGEVDRLYVIVCGQPERKLQRYIEAKIKDVGGRLVEFAPILDHGQALHRALADVTEDLVMLCEDDAFVRKSSKVGECFARIERDEVDVVGCPRGSATNEILAFGVGRFGQLTASNGEGGPFLWPCFLFAKRADLERIDHYTVWSGDSLLGRQFATEQTMDTFGYASMMLRENGARIGVEPNYRANRDRMDDWGGTPWFHVGSLSTGWGRYVGGTHATEEVWATLRRGDLEDWTKRVAFWEIVADRGDDLPAEREQYRADLATLVRETGMSRKVIDDWRSKFTGLMN